MRNMWSCEFPFCSVQNYHGNLGFLSWNIIERSWKFYEACLWEPCVNPIPQEYSGLSTRRVIKSLAPGGFDYSLKLVNFKLISTINIWSIFSVKLLSGECHNTTDHYSTLVQVMAWCPQATSHYLSQCWPRSLLPYDVTRPQCVNLSWLSDAYMCQWTRSSLVQIIVWCQAIIWTNTGSLLNEPLGTNFNDKLIEILTFSFRKMHFKMLFKQWDLSRHDYS